MLVVAPRVKIKFLKASLCHFRVPPLKCKQSTKTSCHEHTLNPGGVGRNKKLEIGVCFFFSFLLYFFLSRQRLLVNKSNRLVSDFFSRWGAMCVCDKKGGLLQKEGLLKCQNLQRVLIRHSSVPFVSFERCKCVATATFLVLFFLFFFRFTLCM